jgi:hypothetical protein
MREHVSFSGLIRGEGHEASCTINAMKVTLPGTSESAYVDYSIQGVSKPLPEGNYEVTARGETTHMRFHDGHWLAVP